MTVAPPPPPSALQITRPVLQWLREDPAWRSQSSRTRARLAWNSAWASLNQRLSQAMARQADDAAILPAPLLILGPWRSGSTAMHEMLAAASGLATPRTWQCMNASAFGFSGTPAADSARYVARPMDGMAITATSPQEDEFALLTLGVPSAYRAFLMPHRVMEMACTLEQSYWATHPSWLSTWQFFLRGVLQLNVGASKQTLLLKSPNHTFRLQAILAAMPDCQVVWMTREPAEVFHSNRKMWGAMFKQYGLTAASQDGLDQFLALAIDKTAHALNWAMDNMPSGQLVIVDQAQLAASPVATTLGVLRKLRAEDAIHHQALSEAAQRLGPRAAPLGQAAAAQAVPGIAQDACRHLSEVQARALALHATSKVLKAGQPAP